MAILCLLSSMDSFCCTLIFPWKLLKSATEKSALSSTKKVTISEIHGKDFDRYSGVQASEGNRSQYVRLFNIVVGLVE